MKLILTDCATLHNGYDISLDIFKNFGTVEYYENIDHSSLKEAAKDADIILCNKTVIDEDIMSSAQNLKYIGLFATGYNNIDIESAKKHSVTVCNAGSYSTNAVAQQVFAYILSHYAAVDRYNDFVKDGGWKNSDIFDRLMFTTDEIAGKTLGIIGYGSIGKKVAKIALGFDMNVLVFTRTPKNDETVSFVSFEHLLKNSDIITAHCPLNNQSIGMFNAKAFEMMKDGAYFINTARGGIVDENALFNALKSGKLSGAAVDVLSNEPMSEDCVLFNTPNITITPHVAWAPLSTRKNLVDIVAGNITAFLSGKPENVVSI